MAFDRVAGAGHGVVLIDDTLAGAVGRGPTEPGPGFIWATEGEHRLRLHVEEAPASELALQAGRSGRSCQGLLRVPSGRLRFSGLDELGLPVAPVEIPPGDYRLEAYEIDWTDEQIEEAVRARVEPGDLRTDQLYGPLVGGLVFLTLLIALVGLLLLVEELLRGGPAALWRALKVWAAAVTAGGLASGAAMALLTRSGAFIRLNRARDEVHRLHPTLVVVLTREP